MEVRRNPVFCEARPQPSEGEDKNVKLPPWRARACSSTGLPV